MNIQKIPSEKRGQSDLGWLKSRFSFSFANYHNPEHVHFGQLRVLNDDWVQAGKGFGMHPHDNMEIVTIMLSGSIQHTDSMGNKFVIKPGEVQRMSAGSGILHSEMNASDSEAATLLQTWVFPQEKNIDPSYQQKYFEESERENTLQLLVSPTGQNNSLTIHQNAYYSRIKLSPNQSKPYSLFDSNNGVYCFVISGNLSIGKIELKDRDAAQIKNMDTFDLTSSSTTSDVLFIEVPLH